VSKDLERVGSKCGWKVVTKLLSAQSHTHTHTHRTSEIIIFLIAYIKALALFVEVNFKRTDIAVCYFCKFDVVL